MVNQKPQVQVLLRQATVHDRGMSKPDPSCVPDLGFDLRHKVLLLFLVHGQKIILPLGEAWIVLAQEKGQIFIGLERNANEIGCFPALRFVNSVKGIVGGL